MPAGECGKGHVEGEERREDGRWGRGRRVGKEGGYGKGGGVRRERGLSVSLELVFFAKENKKKREKQADRQRERVERKRRKRRKEKTLRKAGRR